MKNKYNKEFVMDITQTFIQNEDFDFIQKKMYEEYSYPLPHKISVYTIKENSGHGRVDENALAEMGEQLLNHQIFSNINAYILTLPSVNQPGSYHALALMIDKKNKEILYQDSYGIDMRKELRDFFKLLFPDYKIGYKTQIQQYKNLNDNSCFVLAQYNVLDMWHQKTGNTEAIKQFDSFQAREDAWQYIKQIKLEQPKYTLTATQKLSKSKTLPKRFMIEHNRNTIKDFKYSLPKQKNYKELLLSAVQKAKQKHFGYHQWLINRNLLKNKIS